MPIPMTLIDIAPKLEPGKSPFEDVSIYSPPGPEGDATKLSSPRSYTLSLSPQLIYSRSSLLPVLISSKVFRQLEFQAVGGWWIQKPGTGSASEGDDANSASTTLYRVPGSREDVFADKLISVKSKRTLMRFLRHISRDQQDSEESEEEDLSMPLPDYLSSKLQVPDELHDPLLSLSLSQNSPKQTPANYAVSRIKQHLASIGVFGPGFGSLIAKWGGGSEIASDSPESDDGRTRIQLSNGDTVTTKFTVGSYWDLPSQPVTSQARCHKVARSISVVSSPLESLFEITAEGAPTPAGAVVVFPGKSLGQGDDSRPVYLLIHSCDTGECPLGQSVIYGSTGLPGPQGQGLIESAVNELLKVVANPTAKVLWSLRYTQLGRDDDIVNATQAVEPNTRNIISFPPPSLDLAVDDATIDLVRAAWKAIMGEEAVDDEFMDFEDREGAYDDD
ncbi:hypothetical protein PHISCL_09379 [Aspergillus sclerotialis]|uniref:Rab geranylgeranyl transferase escort protein n=1 Tax=Aspergillus sclerotialis TaxID=2070753 RepID=A0A3A2ZG42_9EURO|nr:hypothetical protein PHISCL_09379 [Aspergillus sclerotialis]